jgi:ribosomal protein L14
MVEKFDQKACVLITKMHEFIGQALGDRQARVVRVGMMIHSAAYM